LGSVLANKLTLGTNIKYIERTQIIDQGCPDSPGNANYSVAVLAKTLI
jgi:hypothetical protein